jgi:hypothetical protein
LRAVGFLAFLLLLLLLPLALVAVTCRAGVSAVAIMYINTVEFFLHLPGGPVPVSATKKAKGVSNT